MNKESVKTFTKKHKAKLIIGGAAIVGGGLILIGIKHNNHNELVKMPGFKIKGGLTIGDLGKLGEEYIAHDPTLTRDTAVLEVGNLVFD